MDILCKRLNYLSMCHEPRMYRHIESLSHYDLPPHVIAAMNEDDRIRYLKHFLPDSIDPTDTSNYIVTSMICRYFHDLYGSIHIESIDTANQVYNMSHDELAQFMASSGRNLCHGIWHVGCMLQDSTLDEIPVNAIRDAYHLVRPQLCPMWIVHGASSIRLFRHLMQYISDSYSISAVIIVDSINATNSLPMLPDDVLTAEKAECVMWVAINLNNLPAMKFLTQVQQDGR